MDLEKLEIPCKKAVLMLLFPREIQGIKWENGNFLKSNNCVKFCVLNVFS